MRLLVKRRANAFSCKTKLKSDCGKERGKLMCDLAEQVNSWTAGNSALAFPFLEYILIFVGDEGEGAERINKFIKFSHLRLF